MTSFADCQVERFVATLPPTVTYSWKAFPGASYVDVRVKVAATIRRDLRLATEAGLIPTDAKFWVRDASHDPLSYVELSAWPGNVLSADYAAALMDKFLRPRARVADEGAEGTKTAEPDPRASRKPVMVVPALPQDARLSPDVNSALALLKALADRVAITITKVRADAEKHSECARRTHLIEIRSERLRVAAESGLRIELDPAYAVLVQRAREAAARLGHAVVRQLCGEGGIDFAAEEMLTELVRVDDEARGRAVLYNRGSRCWEVDQRITCSRCDRRYAARRFEATDDPTRIICAECTLKAMCTRQTS